MQNFTYLFSVLTLLNCDSINHCYYLLLHDIIIMKSLKEITTNHKIVQTFIQEIKTRYGTLQVHTSTIVFPHVKLKRPNPFVRGNQNTRFSIIYLHSSTRRKQFVQMKNLRLSRNPGRVFSLPTGTQFPVRQILQTGFSAAPGPGQALDLHFNKRESDGDIIQYKS